MKLHPYGMIYTVLYIILCKLFLETFAKKRSVSIFYTTMLLGVLSVLEYVCSVVLADFLVLKAILIIVMGSFVMMYVFGEKFWRILILMLLYQGLCFVTDCISWTFLNCVFASAGQEYLRSTNLQMFMAILSQILLFCILLIIKKCFIKQNTAILTGMQWIRITIFPIFTIITIISILIYFNMSSSEEQKNVLLCIAFGMLIMNILVFYLIGDILEGEEKLRKEVLFHKRVKSEIDMYHQISENYNQQRKREHEYRNQMMVVGALVKDRKLEKLEDYLSKWDKQPENWVDYFDANHVIVNAILNTKYQEARDKGIVFVVKINDLSHAKIQDEDMVIILSNLLNNAIEACQSCTDKIIKIKLVKEKEQTVISVVNTFGTMPVLVSGEYQTTKENKAEHGIGIRNIKETVDKYGGSYVIRHKDHLFQVVIVIPEK